MNGNGLHEDERERIYRFLEAYKQVEQHLKQEASEDEPHGQAHEPLEWLAKTRHNARVQQELYAFRKLRNVLAHQPEEFMSIPTVQAVERMEAIRDSMLHPERAGEVFRKDVQVITPGNTLLSVLELIRTADYSQFPVVSGKQVVGLLTENGITRWLANKDRSKEAFLVALDETRVADVLDLEGNKQNYRFVSRRTPADEVAVLFREHVKLEAVFVTETGANTQVLLGIATRWDILQKADAITL